MIEIDPRVDVVFKNLSGSPEHPELTESFVNSLYGRSGSKSRNNGLGSG
jgi:hypothetical protein